MNQFYDSEIKISGIDSDTFQATACTITTSWFKTCLCTSQKSWFLMVFFKKKRDTYILVRSKRRKIYINTNTNNNNVSAIQPNKKWKQTHTTHVFTYYINLLCKNTIF